MAKVHISNAERDGEKRAFKAHGGASIATAGGAAYLIGTFEPGWRYSTDVGALTGSASCQNRHLGYVVSGHMHIRLDDGTECEIRPGDVFDLPPGHDAWVDGDEPCILIDTATEMVRYATGQASAPYAEDRHVALVRKGYEAFNTGDVETLVSLMSADVIQHVPGTSAIAGDHKGIESVLALYGQIAELTDNTFRADLVDAHSDGHGHVVAIHQVTATRNGVTRVSRGSILFTFLGDKATDLLELRNDGAGDDAFMS